MSDEGVSRTAPATPGLLIISVINYLTPGDCFSLNSGFTKILCKPEKPLYVFELFSYSPLNIY